MSTFVNPMLAAAEEPQDEDTEAPRARVKAGQAGKAGAKASMRMKNKGADRGRKNKAAKAFASSGGSKGTNKRTMTNPMHDSAEQEEEEDEVAVSDARELTRPKAGASLAGLSNRSTKARLQAAADKMLEEGEDGLLASSDSVSFDTTRRRKKGKADSQKKLDAEHRAAAKRLDNEPHSRDCLCRKQGSLPRSSVADLRGVTFLTESEIKNIEQNFHLLAQVCKAKGEAVFVVRTIQTDHGPVKRKVAALSTDQLRENLAEFSQHIFLDRLVRVFSESGEQKLTMLELIDMYSALSRRAHLKWKCQIAFCVFDYDEDGVLDKHDLIRSITRMLKDTEQTKPSAKDAAIRIQATYRGMKARTNDAQKEYSGKSKTSERKGYKAYKPLASAKKPKGPIEVFVDRILQHCSSIQDPPVMDYRYFETVRTEQLELVQVPTLFTAV
jgi:hypothetical protein